MYGTGRPGGLPGLSGLGGAVADAIAAKSFADAVAWIGSAAGVGVPYNGTATTSAGIAQVWDTLVPIMNGDRAAMVAGVHNADPYIAGIAMNALKRLYESSDGSPNTSASAQAFWASLDPALFEAIAGHPLSSEQWWRAQREQHAAAVIFPILGAGSGTDGNGNVQNLADGFHYAGGSVYDPAFDFGALAAAAQAWAAAHPTASENQPTAEAVQRVQSTASTPAPSGPPSGWHYNGTNGWWGPDGKFYAGKADSQPWADGTPGVDVQAPPPPPPPAAGEASTQVTYGTSSQVPQPPPSAGAVQVLTEALNAPVTGFPAPAGESLTPAPGGLEGFLAMLEHPVLGVPLWGWGLAVTGLAFTLSRRRS